MYWSFQLTDIAFCQKQQFPTRRNETPHRVFLKKEKKKCGALHGVFLRVCLFSFIAFVFAVRAARNKTHEICVSIFSFRRRDTTARRHGLIFERTYRALELSRKCHLTQTSSRPPPVKHQLSLLSLRNGLRDYNNTVEKYRDKQ